MCVPIQLSLNLQPVLEGKHQQPIVVGCGLLHHRQPESVVKLRDTSLPFMHSEHEPANDVGSGLPLLFLLLEGVHLGLGFLVPRHIAVVPFGIRLLALGAPGVLLDAPLGQLRHHRDLPEQFVQFRVNGRAVGEVVLHDAAILQQSVLAAQQLIECRQKPGLDVLLHGAVVAAAVAADQPGGEYPAAAVVEAHAFAPSELGLDNIELVGLDDGLVAFLNIILLNLALVDLPLFIEEINRVAFLRYNPITDTIQFFLRARVQGGSNFLGRVQRAGIR